MAGISISEYFFKLAGLRSGRNCSLCTRTDSIPKGYKTIAIIHHNLISDLAGGLSVLSPIGVVNDDLKAALTSSSLGCLVDTSGSAGNHNGVYWEGSYVAHNGIEI